MDFEKDVLRVRMFRIKKSLTSDILMMLSPRLCQSVNQSRMECK